MDTIANALTSCDSAADAVILAALAVTAAALATAAFACAYIVRQLRSWRIWTKDD